jgi:hypothetical protein
MLNDNIIDTNRLRIYKYFKKIGVKVILEDFHEDEDEKMHWKQSDQEICDFVVMKFSSEEGFTKISFEGTKKWIFNLYVGENDDEVDNDDDDDDKEFKLTEKDIERIATDKFFLINTTNHF